LIKPATYLACLMAVTALAGCNSKEGNKAAKTENVKYEHTTPPKGGDWSDVINATPAGGVMMGNPNAKVHLIEIGSLTCPHCREFEETAVKPLIEKYVKTGKVSYEFRNYIRDTFDMAALLIAKCNGPDAFFPLSMALYADQPNWVAKIQATPEDQLNQLQTLPENQLALQAAKFAGLLDWAAARGVPQAKATQCLTDTAAIDRVVSQSGAIAQDYPDFSGTPNFVIDGTLNNKIASWKELDAALQSALGS
jgi:protein-disulfide isomerase